MQFTNYISDHFVQAVGWTVFHSLWQGLLVGTAYFLILQVLKKQSPQVRYLASGAALLSILGLAIITFLQYYQPLKVGTDFESLPFQTEDFIFNIATVEVSNTTSFVERCWLFLNAHIHTITFLWMLGVSFFTLRMVGGLAYIQYLKFNGTSRVSAYWEEYLIDLATAMHIDRRVQLFQSKWTKVPLVIGHLKPLILLPIGTINNLPAEQVEAIIAHELAHIARHDYFLNVLQSIIEVLFFYHPMVWWISEQIRAEREHCCDDIAIAICGNTLTYAKALASLKSIQQTPPAFAMALGKSKPQLLQRIKRILNHPIDSLQIQLKQQSSTMEKFTITCLLLVAMIFATVQQNKAAEVNNEPILESAIAVADTIPNMSGKTDIIITKNNQKVATVIQDGVIQSLKIDGKSIPQNELEEYESFVADLLEELPTPPVSPVPPTPPVPVSPNAPPAPPSPPSSGGQYYYYYDSEEELEDISGQMEELLEAQRALQEEMQSMIEERQEELSTQMEELRKAQQDGELSEEQLQAKIQVLKEKEQKLREVNRAQLVEAREKLREAERQIRSTEKEISEEVRMRRTFQEEELKQRLKELEERRKKMEKERGQRDDFMKELGTMLVSNKTIKSKSTYSLSWQNGKLKVNNKIMSKEVEAEFQALYMKHHGVQLDSNDSIKIKMKPNSQSVSISVEDESHSYRNEGPLPD